jgi:hypothetical protein
MAEQRRLAEGCAGHRSSTRAGLEREASHVQWRRLRSADFGRPLRACTPRLMKRERGLPPPRLVGQLYSGDPLDPPETAPAGRD